MHENALLADLMRSVADDLAARETEFDFSVASLDVVDRELGSGCDRHRLDLLGVYVGEVFCRNGTSLTWVSGGSSFPIDGIGVADGLVFDPWAVTAQRLEERRGSLSDQVRGALTFASSPTDETAAALELTKVVKRPESNWTILQKDWRRRQRRRRLKRSVS